MRTFISEPQTNTSILADILTKMDPSQHDAVILMNQIAESQFSNTTAILGLQKHSLQSWRNDNDFTSITAELAARSIEHKVSIERITDAIISNAQLAISNGQYAYQLHEAVNLSTVTDIKQTQSIIKKDIE